MKLSSWEFLGIWVLFWFLIGIGVMSFWHTEKKEHLNTTVGQTVRFWKDLIEPRDYTSTKWKLTDEGKTIIHQVRDLHKAPLILKEDERDDWLCAGYLFELSAMLWWKDAPTDIGMRDPRTHKAANAWELPYGYRYRGWTILTWLSDKIKTKPLNYWSFVTNEDLKNIFLNAFSEPSILWDIWFLYKNTTVLSQLWSYGNYNSHITKNFGISTFSRVIKETENSASKTIRDTLWCDANVWYKLNLVLPHYQFLINGKATAFSGSDLRATSGKQMIWTQAIVLKPLDTIKIQDITLAHFFHGALVDSLLQLVCKWAFYPVNVTSINPKFIEKM